MTFTTTVEIELEVECSIEPAERGGNDSPSYEAYANVDSITYDGRSFIPSKELLAQIEETADEHLSDTIADAKAEAAEARYEAYRDREVV